jgi:hypothetical protein
MLTSSPRSRKHRSNDGRAGDLRFAGEFRAAEKAHALAAKITAR